MKNRRRTLFKAFCRRPEHWEAPGSSRSSRAPSPTRTTTSAHFHHDGARRDACAGPGAEKRQSLMMRAFARTARNGYRGTSCRISAPRWDLASTASTAGRNSRRASRVSGPISRQMDSKSIDNQAGPLPGHTRAGHASAAAAADGGNPGYEGLRHRWNLRRPFSRCAIGHEMARSRPQGLRHTGGVEMLCWRPHDVFRTAGRQSAIDRRESIHREGVPPFAMMHRSRYERLACLLPALTGGGRLRAGLCLDPPPRPPLSLPGHARRRGCRAGRSCPRGRRIRRSLPFERVELVLAAPRLVPHRRVLDREAVVEPVVGRRA